MGPDGLGVSFQVENRRASAPDDLNAEPFDNKDLFDRLKPFNDDLQIEVH